MSISKREIRAYLRGAVMAKILDGWYQPTPHLFVIAPSGGETQSMTLGDARIYCKLLVDAGIEKVFRESEPADL